MVEFKSKVITVERSVQEVYEFLGKAENYELLMPSNVRSFKTMEEGAIIDLQGVGEIELAFVRKEPFSLIEMKPQNKVPFTFDIQWSIEEQGAGASVQAVIHAKLNFMMRMMAEKLLVEFLDVQVDKLKESLRND